VYVSGRHCSTVRIQCVREAPRPATATPALLAQPSASVLSGSAPLVGILYEGWHAYAAHAMSSVEAKGGRQWTVEELIRSNGGANLSDVWNQYGVAGETDGFYYQSQPSLGFYCIYRARQVRRVLHGSRGIHCGSCLCGGWVVLLATMIAGSEVTITYVRTRSHVLTKWVGLCVHVNACVRVCVCAFVSRVRHPSFRTARTFPAPCARMHKTCWRRVSTM